MSYRGRGLGFGFDMPRSGGSTSAPSAPAEPPGQRADASSPQLPAQEMPSGLSQISPATLQSLTQMGTRLMAPIAPAPFQIVPPECAKLVQPTPAPEQLPANVPVVVAFPLVTLTDAQVTKVLAQIYGDGSGGPAFVEGLGSRTPAPNFSASGWMRDTESNQSKTRGALWISLGFPSTISRSSAQLTIRQILMFAYRAAGVTAPVPIGGSPVLADGDSDQALQAAAMASAVTLVMLAEIFSTLIGGASIRARDAKSISTTFDRLASSVVKAAQNVASAPSVIGQVDGAVSAAMAAPPDQATTVVQQLQQLRAALETMKTEIITGVSNISQLQTEIAANDDPNGALAMRIRNEIVADVQADVNRIDVAIGREYRRCLYFSLAQRSLDGFLRTVAAAFERGSIAMHELQNNTDAIAQVLAGLTTAIEKIRVAEQQVPLAWFERDLVGVPVWAWMAGGTTAFLGGVFTLRAIKRRRRAAQAPKPNRRRRRIS